jgi:ComF family protein
MWKKSSLKNFLLELFFPQFCLLCKKEGEYLCQDCRATLEISLSHQKYSTKNLNDLYFALPYQNHFVKNLIQSFKYEPFIKELSKPLASLIIEHFQLIEKPITDFSNYILIPIPLKEKRQRWRGFNQAEEIAIELSKFLKIPLINDVLIKIKETLPQVELSERERKENISGAFSLKNNEKIIGRKILLVDDVYTTGSTMEEAARVLKKAGAKEVIGIVIARG